MQRELSSTFFTMAWKYVFPIVQIFLVGYLAIGNLIDPSWPSSSEEPSRAFGILLLIMWIPFTYAMCRIAWPLKFVTLQGTSLHLEGTFSSILVPVTDIETLRLGKSMLSQVKITFKQPTRYGKVVCFIAPLGLANKHSKDAMEWIQQAIKRASPPIKQAAG